MKTLIRNNTQSPVALPLPYTGILSAGEGIVVDEPTNEVVASLFGGDKALTNTYTVTQVSGKAQAGRISRKETARKIAQALDQAPVDLSINGVKLRKVGTPTVDTDAATKAYTDAGDAALRALLDASPRWYYAERYFELGDVSTGIWYVTVAARASTTAALDAITAVKHTSSVAGAMGTFSVQINNPVGVAVESVTLFTYTRRETQPRIVLVMNNPTGPRHAHRFVRPSVIQFPPTNAQKNTPMVSVADSDGLVPAAYGVVGQLNPEATYSKIRIVATGFFASEINAVSDRNYNKPQSLVVQF